MKENREKRSGHIYARIIMIYLAVCLFLVVACVQRFNALAQESSSQQVDTITGMMAEKINNSISIMTGYVEQLSALVTARDAVDTSQCYEELQSSLSTMPYISIGLIGEDGQVYGTEGEVYDFEKYGFVQLRENNPSGEIYITDPYRSSVSGNNVITMFGRCSGDNFNGEVFVTYPLEELQRLAETEILRDEAEVFLMNSYSGNYISCSPNGEYKAGSWNNLRLSKKEIKVLGGESLEDWVDSMQDNQKRGVLNYEKNGIAYNQAFENITSMEDWFVVVRMQNEYLGGMLTKYRATTLVLILALAVCSLTVVILLLRMEAKKKKELTALSTTDALTETMNRRALQSMLEQYFGRPEGSAGGILMFLDIDYFKNFNDTYGHEAGDRVLCLFANALRRVFARDSIISRVGGDEFIVFLKKPRLQADVDALLKELHEELSEQRIPGVSGTLSIYFSAGMAEYPEDAQNVETLKRHADEALYYVKRGGRNSCCWYSHIPKEEHTRPGAGDGSFLKHPW